jgi:hypothetical protein
MTVKPHEELVYKKKNKNLMGNHPCDPKRNRCQSKVSIQKIFLLDKALDSGPERFYHMVFFQVIKLIDDSSRQNSYNSAENNAVYFKIEDKFTERFILIEEKKSRYIQGKCMECRNKKTGTYQKTHEL